VPIIGFARPHPRLGYPH